MAWLLLLLATAHAEGTGSWITRDGAGEWTWGTANQPLDAVPKRRELLLPDSGFLGLKATDKPDDLELPSVDGDRRFLRYVSGQLVDAWLVRNGPIRVDEFSRIGDLEFEGAVLGPGEDGWRAVGDARSWLVGARSVLHWRDRMSDLEILVSRGLPSSGYAVRREAPLAPGIPSRVKPRITGDMNRWVKPRAAHISGCFDNSPMPVEAKVEVRWDNQGRLARVRATADQPAVELTTCVAGAIADLPALPNQEGSFGLLRLR